MAEGEGHPVPLQPMEEGSLGWLAQGSSTHRPGSRSPCLAPVPPTFSPNLQPQGLETGRLPLPKCNGIKGWQRDPGQFPTQAGDSRQRLRIPLVPQGLLAMGCDMRHFLKTQHPSRGDPQDIWGPKRWGADPGAGKEVRGGAGAAGAGRALCA